MFSWETRALCAPAVGQRSAQPRPTVPASRLTQGPEHRTHGFTPRSPCWNLALVCEQWGLRSQDCWEELTVWSGTVFTDT